MPQEVLVVDPGQQQPPMLPPLPSVYPQHAESHLIREVWTILRRRRWTIIATVIIIMTLVVVGTLKMTPQYEATSRIAIYRESSDALGFKDVGNNASDDDGWDYNVAVDTQVRILQSDRLALAVIDELKLADNPSFAPFLKSRARPKSGVPALDPERESVLLRRFHDALLVSKVPRTRLVEVTFMGPDPRLAADIVNHLITTFIEQNFKTKYESTMQTSAWLQDQLVDLQVKVETSQEKLVRYQKENEIVGLDEKQNITTAKLNELNQQLTVTQGERIQKQSLYNLTRSGNYESLPGASSDPVLEKLKEREADLDNQYAQASTQFGPQYPKVQALSNQLKQVRQSLRGEYGRMANRIEADYHAALDREKMLTAALEHQKQEANKLNESAIEYNVLKREVETNRSLYEGLLQKMKEATVTAGLKSGNIRIVDIARVPVRPSRPNKSLNFALGLLFSFVGSIGLALLIESLDNAVQKPSDVEMVSGLQAIGIIPYDGTLFAERNGHGKTKQPKLTSGGLDGLSVPVARPKSQTAEAYRALRTSIMLSSLSGPPKVILVTSGQPQEGKSTTSMNIATVFAQSGQRVLLVDADLRRPSLARLMKDKPTVGLSDLLAGHRKFEEVAVALPEYANITLIPGGHVPPYPAEMLGSSAMKGWLDTWRKTFDCIVIDSPPALTVTDSVVLSKMVDFVLVVVRVGGTTKPALRRTLEVFAQVNAEIGGIMLNAVDFNSRDGYYTEYSYYGADSSYYTDERGA